ncbi:NUDIX hydrolase [Tenacibaculum piscium]|uniref:NUDIX hydrolase n=1 Tax=Tenacibaculum piscium TaxID=1458515 RepID=UPI001F23BE86|nr:CoA pyrophosphatase [Tenacibaculum piscium]
MNFDDFNTAIIALEDTILGGLSSQLKLAPKIRTQFSEELIALRNPKKAAVLALFYPDENNQTHFVLTLRATYKGAHSAQISFPGGKTAKKDSNLEETALRETFEEVGVFSDEIRIIRPISDAYIPPSNFLVTPFIGVTMQKPVFKKNYEVAHILEILISDLLNDANITSKEMETSYMKKEEVPCFKLNNYIVWGATAMILSEIKDLLKQ